MIIDRGCTLTTRFLQITQHKNGQAAVQELVAWSFNLQITLIKATIALAMEESPIAIGIG